MFRILIAIAFIIASLSFPLESSAGERNSAFEKILVKNRAERYQQTDGVSSNGHELYIYSNDSDIQGTINDLQNNDTSPNGLSIASPTIDRKSRIRKVHIVVDAKKGLQINRKNLGISDEREISIANPKTAEGSRVNKVNILVDAKMGGIAVE